METEDRNNLKDYLPSDISNTSYEAKITNVSNEIVTEAQKTDASYSYNVSKNGNIGNQAEIEFTIHSNNYEDITFKVHITLTDRITVTPKEGTEPAIEGSNELYYGQTISELKLNTKKEIFFHFVKKSGNSNLIVTKNKKFLFSLAVYVALEIVKAVI